jgi:hypothetical protein
MVAIPFTDGYFYTASEAANDDPPSLRYGATRKAVTCYWSVTLFVTG